MIHDDPNDAPARSHRRPALAQKLRLRRATFSIAWAAAAFSVGRDVPPAAAALLVAYPAWDAMANLVDARRSGGLGVNRSQSLNAAVSAVTTVATVVALGVALMRSSPCSASGRSPRGCSSC
jgi:hypothetical protein